MNDTAKRYFERVVFELGSGFYGWMTSQGPWAAHCEHMARRIQPGAREVVDLGCGPGVSSFAIARVLPEATVTGLDLAGRMLVQARERGQRMGWGGRLGWMRGDVHHLPFKDRAVDAMTGHSFLYLVPDPDHALGEIRRCLKPGGRLILVEPRRGGAPLREVLKLGTDPRFLLSMSLWRPVSRMQGQYTEATLGDALGRAGYQRVSVEPTLKGLGLLASGEA